MRKIISLLLALALFCVPCAAEAANPAGGVKLCGDSLSWSLTGSALYITGSGDMYDFPDGAPWASWKDSIVQVIIGDGVTGVGAGAFKDYDNLAWVDFGSSLVQIGAEAFSSCDGLSTVVLPATFKKFGSNSFRSCKNLTAIYCSGYFPRFDEGSMWDTSCTIYYSSANPWAQETISQLVSAFQGRIQFSPYSGDPPASPIGEPAAGTSAEIDRSLFTGETYVTEPVTTAVIFSVPTEAATVPTAAPATVPATMPVTTPAAEPSVPETTQGPTAPSIADPLAETIAPETSRYVEHATPPTRSEETRRGTDGSSVYGVLLLVTMLAIIAISALLFRELNRPRKRKKRRR